MKLLVLAVIFVVYISVVPEVDAQAPYIEPSSCQMNVVGCPSNSADKKCNRCCRRAGCNRGDCHTYNCKCKGCRG